MWCLQATREPRRLLANSNSRWNKQKHAEKNECDRKHCAIATNKQIPIHKKCARNKCSRSFSERLRSAHAPGDRGPHPRSRLSPGSPVVRWVPRHTATYHSRRQAVSMSCPIACGKPLLIKQHTNRQAVRSTPIAGHIGPRIGNTQWGGWEQTSKYRYTKVRETQMFSKLLRTASERACTGRPGTPPPV